MALDDTLAGSIIGVSAGLTIVRQNHQAVVLVPIHSRLGVQTVVLHQCWVTIGIASIMLMPYLRGSGGVVAVPLRFFDYSDAFDVMTFATSKYCPRIVFYFMGMRYTFT